jgi:hypothetical protein
MVFFILVTHVCWSNDKFPVISKETWGNNSSELMKSIFDNEQEQKNTQYKDEQNKLPDDKRERGYLKTSIGL